MDPGPLSFPTRPAERDAWILSRRGPRAALDPRVPVACFVENERADSGEIVRVTTIFLTNRECPWRCLMCDLWKNTLPESVSPGEIPAQIDYALAALSRSAAVPDGCGCASESGPARPGLPAARHIKLYNSGSFFDAGAIPPEDHPAIARQVAGFDRLIVECHPALIGDRVLRFREQLRPRLEIAMGLETVHPEILEKLNKRMTTAQFASAAAFLRAHDIALRVFILIKPPFLAESAAVDWAARSVRFAFDCGASVVALIPTRSGNGALDALVQTGEFGPPRLDTVEDAIDAAMRLGRGRGRVLADVWDLERFSQCPRCLPARRERLARMNLSQAIEERCGCEGACGMTNDE